MNTKNQISKWINGNTPVKMVAGLALGAMLMAAIALPSNASADTPKRPMTNEQQLVVMAEIEDGFYDTVSLTPEQQLMVRAEIEDGFYDTVSLTPEEQLVVRAEIDDGFYDLGFLTAEELLVIQAEMEDGFGVVRNAFTDLEKLIIQAEVEDGYGSVAKYPGGRVDLSQTGADRSVLQALQSHDVGSAFSAEEWLVILAEIEDTV